MYYEEQIIDGRLMFRQSPDGKWQICPIDKLHRRIVEMDAEIEYLKEQISAAQKEAEERWYMQGKKYEKDRMKELLGLSS
ncbi:hypothetical protein [Thiolapillus sp.]